MVPAWLCAQCNLPSSLATISPTGPTGPMTVVGPTLSPVYCSGQTSAWARSRRRERVSPHPRLTLQCARLQTWQPAVLLNLLDWRVCDYVHLRQRLPVHLRRQATLCLLVNAILANRMEKVQPARIASFPSSYSRQAFSYNNFVFHLQKSGEAR